MKPKISFSEEQKDWIKRPLLYNIEKILDYRGRTPKKLGLSWSDTGFLALSALNVKNGYIDFNADANYGDQELYDRWMGDNHLHKGQVVFTTEAPMGNVAQIPNDDLYILSQRTIAFEVKHDLIREDFLATLLRSPKIFNELTSLSSGGTAKGVSQKSLSNLKVCVPASLEEQSAIGSLFCNLDDLLSSYKENLANYQSLKVTMLSRMFPKAGQIVPEIRLDGFEGEWEVQTLKELACFSKGNGYTKNELVNSGKEIILYGRLYTNYQTVISKVNTFVATVKANAVISKGGEVIVPASGESAEDISRASVVEKSGVILGGDLNIIYPDENKVDSIFLALTISNGSQQKELIKRAQGKSVVHLRNNDLEKVVLHYPSMEEQQAIGAYFSNLDNLINSHQEKISQLETLKKKLLQDIFI
ncbi:restriction endonuclease subunit S [Streptococcus parasanguinis]|jgi:type I restriction modification DNA specificity domain protein|uniref:restriction endonuclease subunit S n=1 Tax=Streptococcus parasanguinis TaxID=1318 RepID=UPI00080B2DA3|nr:restriction endonuclease subunit S [Streptococcus parasanguinis]MDB8628258.1 restriction endonuclease subunit S [Streptococcus parasanguinis]MDU2684070.1 restriction endonuclease subunit S [Streptococcus parasanguinis]MDU4523429.1 restriction endonuclease subunit S [Streptococcus parasanguinis]